MSLAAPWYLALLPVVWGAAVLAARHRPPALRVARLAAITDGGPQPHRGWRLPLGCELAGACFLVVAAARPQTRPQPQPEERLAADIMVLLDISGSMAAVDLPATGETEIPTGRPNRLDQARDEIRRFLAARPEDRFGLILFAQRPYPYCPLTLDHDLLGRLLDDARTDLIEDGTDLTAAIALGATRLRQGPAGQRTMILVTDGCHNVPAPVSPPEAAALAAREEMVVHVVAIGSARAVVPVERLGGIDWRPAADRVDDAMLQAVAEAGQGVHARGADAGTFRAALQRIDAAERRRVVHRPPPRPRDLFPHCLAAAGILLVAGFLLDRTVCLRVP